MRGPATPAEWLVVLNAIVGLLFGLDLLLVPQLLLAILGLQTDTTGIGLGRLYGAELLGFSTTTFLVRNNRPVPRWLAAGHVVNEGLTAIVVVTLALTGLGNVLLWIVAIPPALFAIGYALALGGRLPDEP